MNRFRLVLGALLGAALTVTATTATAASHTTNDTLNWAGYVDVPHGGKVTNVAGDFVVPRIRSDLPPGVSSTWVGIGGSSTSDLIQAGVGENSPPTPLTGAAYYAWYELLPDSATPLAGCSPRPDCPVQAGDRMHVAIDRVRTNVWRISVVDAHRWSWRKTVSYASSGSSAEWIAEASSIVVPLTYGDLSTTTFSHGTFVAAGRRHAIRTRDAELDTMSLLGVAREATPSALNRAGDGFNVCAWAQQCAAPR